MGVSLKSLRDDSIWNTINQKIKGPAATAGKVREMDNIGKSLDSVFKVFDLPYMPELPPFFQKLAANNRVCIDLIASFKGVFSLKKITQSDAVGRAYWETHTVTEIGDVAFILGSQLISTVRYLAKLADIPLPASLSRWKLGLTFLSYSCRSYNDFSSLNELYEDLSDLELKKTKSERKESLTLGKYQEKYLNKRRDLGKEIAALNAQLEALCKKPQRHELAKKRIEAFDCLEKIQEKSIKVMRCEKYLFALDFCPKKRFEELKSKKWQNRIEMCNDSIKDRQYSRAFHTTFAATLALALVSAAFSLQSVAMKSVLAFMGVAVSAIGMKWLVDKPAEKVYEII